MAVRGRRRSPWALLAGRDDIVVRLARLPDGFRGLVDVMPDGRWLILLDQALSQAERSTVLRHELEHCKRGGGADLAGMPSTWAAVVARDEAACDRAAADELVPAAVLDEWLAHQLDGVSALDVAEEWQVSTRIARIALAGASLRRHPAARSPDR